MSEHLRDRYGRFIKGGGFKLSERHKENIRRTKIGEKNPMYGKHLSEKSKERLRLKLAGKYVADLNGAWKGYDAILESHSLHQWIRRRLPQPDVCPICKVKPSYPFDLANITGTYNRDFINWQYLCRKCHMRFDIEKGTRKKGDHYGYSPTMNFSSVL